MKNIESPTAEKFKLTVKKKRMIKSLMCDFIDSNSYCYQQGEYFPEPNDVIAFLRERLACLKHIPFVVWIETVNNIWSGLMFDYFAQTVYVHAPFFKPSLKRHSVDTITIPKFISIKMTGLSDCANKKV